MDSWSLARLDATAQAALVARGEVSADGLVEAALARIDALNPLLRAVVTVGEAPFAAAKGGPFRGVPFLVKDSTPWPGLRWSMGARLFAGQEARRQTPHGAALAAAGLVCIGKSATSEFGLLASTETLLEGATHNPWDLSRSAAGSSGGAAAAVAAGLVPVAHGNDGGGSLRAPASACGVFGFKPGRGRTLPSGLAGSDFGDMTSDGCVSRSVRDAARWLEVTEDPAAGSPTGFVAEPARPGLRVAAWTRTMLGGEATPGVRHAFEETCSLLEALGHRVEPVEAPAYEAERLVEAFFRVAGAAVSDAVDAVDRSRGEPVQVGELEPFTWALVERYLAQGAEGLVRAREAFARAAAAYRDATRGFDVVLTPTLAAEPWPLGYLSPLLDADTLIARTGGLLGYTPIHNVVGCPAMSVPSCVSDAGLPVGMQFAAAAGGEGVLLGLAYQLEEARPWGDRWPAWSAPRLAELRERQDA